MDIEEFILSRNVFLFDLDNTLCNHDEAVESARREAYFHAERLAALSGGGDLAARNAFRERVKARLAEPPEPILFDQTGLAHHPDTWMEILRPLGIENRLAASRAATTFERRRMEETKPLPEIKKVLEILKRTHRLYILAGGIPAFQRAALRRMRMDEWVKGVLFETELEASRPDPAFYREALAKIGATPEESVVAGDDPERDLSGAKALGCFTLWRKPASLPDTDAPVSGVDFTCRSLLELFPRLERAPAG